jgi:hypothetical protein
VIDEASKSGKVESQDAKDISKGVLEGLIPTAESSGAAAGGDTAGAGGGNFLYDIQQSILKEILRAGTGLTITPSTKAPCPNEEVTFTIATAPSGATINWSGGGNPATGTGPTFKTKFPGPGAQTVKAEWTTDAGSASATASVEVAELSGVAWVTRYPNSQSTSDLDPTFKTAVESFIAAMQTAGATVSINQTRRTPENEYLMYHAYRVGDAGVDPTSVPANADINICWAHRDTSGKVDKAASAAAAHSMVQAWHIVYAPAAASRHGQGLAIDMDISWTGNLAINDSAGKAVNISSTPRDGGNADLQTVGRGYGVIKLASDPPHWSSDGR